MGRMFVVARKLAKEEGIDEDGYRLIVNCNSHGGQLASACLALI